MYSHESEATMQLPKPDLASDIQYFYYFGRNVSKAFLFF